MADHGTVPDADDRARQIEAHRPAIGRGRTASRDGDEPVPARSPILRHRHASLRCRRVAQRAARCPQGDAVDDVARCDRGRRAIAGVVEGLRSADRNGSVPGRVGHYIIVAALLHDLPRPQAGHRRGSLHHHRPARDWGRADVGDSDRRHKPGAVIREGGEDSIARRRQIGALICQCPASNSIKQQNSHTHVNLRHQEQESMS